MHKQGQGDHVSPAKFAEYDFNTLWDSTWSEMEKIEMRRRDKATPASLLLEIQARSGG